MYNNLTSLPVGKEKKLKVSILVRIIRGAVAYLLMLAIYRIMRAHNAYIFIQECFCLLGLIFSIGIGFSGLKMKVIVENIIENTGISFMFSALLLFASVVCYKFYQIIIWLKTGNWALITLHKLLSDHQVIENSFVFNFPEARGVEKIFNYLLFDSLGGSCFILSLIAFALGLLMLSWRANFKDSA